MTFPSTPRAAALGALLCLAALACGPLAARAVEAPRIPDVAYEQFRLGNGLRVVVHEDRSVPAVAVNVWYGVGSRDEWTGGAGFAHLFEHLMFNGSEHFPQDFIAELENLGAKDLNGTTNRDRTNYFQTVPTAALDRVLWLESDRMAHLLGGVSQKTLATQKEVVLREKEQRETQPFGRLYGHVLRNLYPRDHPYHWETIGYREDIENASMDSIKPWFDVWYRPSNAVLVLAGDIDLETARRKVEHYFGAMPRQPPPRRVAGAVPRLRETRRVELTEAAPFSRVYWVWPVPRDGGRDAVMLGLFCSMLAGGRGRPLWEEMVVERQLANFVGCQNYASDLGGELLVYMEAAEGADLDEAADAMREVLDRHLGKKAFSGQGGELLEAVRGQRWGGIMRALESLGGFGGRADILAAGAMLEGSPHAYKRELAWMRDASVKDVAGAARRWLRRGYLDIRVRSGERMQPVQGEDFGPWIAPPRGLAAQKQSRPGYRDPVVRAALPTVDAAEPPRVPQVLSSSLGNGLEVMLLPRKGAPLVAAEIHFATGSADDPADLKGMGGFGAHMMLQGTVQRTGSQLRTDMDALAARLNAFSDQHHSGISLSLPIHNLEKGMALLREVLLDPRFDAQDTARELNRWQARIVREMRSPRSRALRELPPLLFGKDHPYGAPFSDAGIAEHLRELSYPDLAAWHKRLLSAAKPRLLLVGDLSLEQAVDLAQRHFGQLDLYASGAPSTPPTLDIADGARIFLQDSPDAGPQAVLFFGLLLPPMDPADAELAAHAYLFNEVVGGSFQSRLNTLIREEKGWSYGAGAYLLRLRSQTMLVVLTQVPTAQAAEATRVILDTMRQASTLQPPTEEEFMPHQRSATYRLATGQETGDEFLGWLSDLVRRGRNPDFTNRYGKALNAVDVDTLTSYARRVPLVPWTALIVGDADQMEGPLGELGLPLTRIEDDGGPSQGGAD